MKLLRTISELNEWRLHTEGQSLGFVPTMGALHEGHFSLAESSLNGCGLTLVSIYVNPTQFNNAEDLQNYPNTLDADLEALQAMNVDAVYLPQQAELYPDGPVSRQFDFGTLGTFMEGAGRPGHFEGMATVVTRFFEIIKPDYAYFGEKDFQQLAIIRYVVATEGWPVVICPGETVREADGLAMSSRNLRLTEAERLDAGKINRIVGLWRAEGNWSKSTPQAEKDLLQKRLNEVASLNTEYVEIANPKTLVPLQSFSEAESARVFIAVGCGKVRLIDNYPLF